MTEPTGPDVPAGAAEPARPAGVPDPAETTATDALVLVVIADAPGRDRSARLPATARVLRHRPPRGAAARWNLLAVQPVADEASAEALAAGLDPAETVRAALGRVQPGLDLWQPRTAGRRLRTIVEYVWSEPAERADYYRSQYRVSGPAMRALWSAGRIGRFVGVEVLRDLRPPTAGTPDWDLLHLTGLTLRQAPRMLGWSGAFDAHARAAGYADMAEVRARWADQRRMVKSLARELPPDAGGR